MNIKELLTDVMKPGRYTGGEFGEVIKDKKDIKCRLAFCFPDTYEIGMSNLGMRILYGCLNNEPDIWCERVFAPWIDFEKNLREKDVPLFALESRDPIKDFDIVAFTLSYELCYSNVLNMLELAKIPMLSKDRDESYPIVIAGGPCTCNPEPVADFIDIFSIGEGEEAIPELSRLYIDMKESGSYTKEAFLHAAAKLEGFYVPSLYQVDYNEDGTVKEYRPIYDDIPKKIKKRVVSDFETAYFPTGTYMPYIETVQDRITLEVARGCIRGCRFCQAGNAYRPIRERSPETLNRLAKEAYDKTGYDEMSLSCLSISDYSRVNELTDLLLSWTEDNHVSLSLPSLRADSFTKELMDKVSTVRTSSLTFAPEAGTQRMRDIINKNVTEEDLMRAVRVAFEAGKTTVKLYFMNGLPRETNEDIEGINLLAERVLTEYYNTESRNKRMKPGVTVSVSCFIPKPFTAFQWEPQDTLDELVRKQEYLKEKITNKKIKYHYHDAKVSCLEGVFARGDRRLSKAILKAHEKGIKFCAWDECFDYDGWMDSFSLCGIDSDFYSKRRRSEDEVFPWDIIDHGVTKEYLLREKRRSEEEKTTPSCRLQCNGCGADRFGGCQCKTK